MAQPRFTYRRSFFSGYFTPGVKWLLIINTAVFLLWAIGGPALQSQILTQFALAPEAHHHATSRSGSSSPTCSCTAASGT